MVLLSQISLKVGWRMVAVRSGSVLNSSAFKLSLPGVFQFFKHCMADVISGTSGGLVLIFNSDSGSLISGSWIGGGLFKISLKCSVHRSSISFSDVNSFPCLSLMGRFGDGLFFPHITFVILYRFPCSPLLAASSTFVAKASMYHYWL